MTARRPRIPQYGCLRCGIGVWEYRAICRDCLAVTYTLKEAHLWTEPKAPRREFMARVNDYGLVPSNGGRHR